MARERMTLDQIHATRPSIDRARLAATTDEDIARHQIEDGEGPDDRLPAFQWVPNVKSIRAKLRMTQESFAAAIGIPVATIRNWEQSRTRMDPAARALMRVLQREPDAVLRALAK
jgi:putative transcriptional regulator